jgi:Conserved phage C-terminus (Phg_2220_C).
MTPVAKNATATPGEKRHPTKTNNKTNINNPPIVPPAEQVVLDYLNMALANLAEEQGERKPTGYKLTDKTKQAIGARLAEFDLDVCKRVVDYLVSKWGRDPKMVEYLRPSTIFRPTNFGEYVVGSERWDNKGRPEMRDGAWVMADGTMLKPKGSAPNPASKSTDWAKGRQIQIRNPQVAEKLRKMGMLK